MSDINQVFITGNIGKAPEMKYFDSGKCVCNFSVAIKEWAGQEKGERTTWIDCRAWAKKSRICRRIRKKRKSCHGLRTFGGRYLPSARRHK